MSRSSLVLASTSPRRRELVALLKIPFIVVDPCFAESRSAREPVRQALDHADGKAMAVSRKDPGALVLAADTLIDLDGRILGKPHSQEEARAMLTVLRGRDHVVHSAVALRRGSDHLTQSAMASVPVRMRSISDPELDRYLRSKEWTDKAGAYAIQGAGGDFIEAIEGDYTAVVGLPLRLVAELLAPYMTVPDVEEIYRARSYGNWSRFSSP